MRYSLLVSLFGALLALPGIAQQPVAASPPAAIRRVLAAQTAAWNRGDIPAFMEGYWRSPATEFIGAGGITRGFATVRDRYLHNYPNRAAMGQLTFSDLEIQILAPDAAYVTGHFALRRAHDHPHGVFTLLFRRFPQGWRVVSDHTTAATG